MKRYILTCAWWNSSLFRFLVIMNVLVVGALCRANGQNVSVLGSLAQDGSYATLSAAISAIGTSQAGASIVVTIVANTTETTNSSIGAGTWAKLSIVPGGNRTVSCSTAGITIITFNGASNVVIDGLNTGGNSLTFSSTVTAAPVIQFGGTTAATFDTLRNCTILSQNTTVTSGAIYFLNLANANNVITECNIGAGAPASAFPANAIYALVSASGQNVSNTISNCNISDYYHASLTSGACAGITYAGGTSFTGNGWTITGNQFFQTVSRTYTTTTAISYKAISINSGGGGWTISNNVIGYANSSGTGTTIYSNAAATSSSGPVFRGIEILGMGTSAANNIQGNTIAGISFTTSNTSLGATAPGIFTGIYLAAPSASFDMGTTAGNVIGIPSTGPITVSFNQTTTSTASYVAGIYTSSAGTSCNINNNTVSAITYTRPVAITTGAYNFNGIHTAGSGTYTVNNNRIGGAGGNDITIGVSSSSSSDILNGIQLTNTGGALTVKGDTVQNITSYSTSTSNTTTVNGIFVTGNTGGALIIGGTSAGEGNVISGITVAAPSSVTTLRGISLASSNTGAFTVTCSGNKITGLTSSTINTGANSSEAIAGILDFAVKTGAHTYDKDTISNLSATPASGTTIQVSGIVLNAGTSGGAYTITRNLIYGFTHSGGSGGGFLNGISYSAGSNTSVSTVANNMITFNNNNGVTIRALVNQSGLTASATNYYHNTVYLGGNPSVAASTFCFLRSNVATVNVRNNIFVNERSGTGSHYCIGVGSNTANFNTDYNLLGSSTSNPSTIGSVNSVSKDFAGWQTSLGGDSHSASGVTTPAKLSFTDVATGNLKLNMAAATITPVDSGGLSGLGIATDFEGDARNSSFPDLGADEVLTYYSSDIAASAFVFPANGGIVGASFSPQAEFADSGVYKTGVTVRYRIIDNTNTEVYNHTTTTGLISFGAPATITFPVCTLAAGIYSIQIISELSTDMNRLNDTLNGTMTVAAPLCGTYHINTGGGGDYLSITSTINDLNLRGVSCNTTFLLDNATYSSQNSLPAINGYYGSTLYTATFKPNDGLGSQTISGANATALIDLNGAQRVIFDGSNDQGNKILTIQNTNTSGATVRFINDASNDSIKNCKILGVPNTGTSGILHFSTTTGTTGNDNNGVDNCDIDGGAGATASPTTTAAICVYASGTTSSVTLNNNNNTISNCNIFNYFHASVASAGINILAGNTDWNITGNKFYQTSARTFTSAVEHTPITINNTTSGNNFQILNNIIGYAGYTGNTGTGVYTLNGAVAHTFKAIEISAGSSVASTIRGNTITAISHSTSTSGSGFNTAAAMIYVGSGGGLVNIGDENGGNIIGSLDGSTSVDLTTSASSGEVYGIYSLAASPITIKKNQIGSFRSNVTTTTNTQKVIGIACDPSTVPTTIVIDSNIVGGTGATFATGAIQHAVSGGSIGSGRIVGISTGFSTTSNGAAHNIRGNTVRNLITNSNNTGTGTSSSAIGILYSNTSATATAVVSGNTVYSVTSLGGNVTTILGICLNNSSSNVITLSGNLIYNIFTNNTLQKVRGIETEAGAATISNNMVSLGYNASGGDIAVALDLIGIYDLLGTNSLYYNSIMIGGTVTSTSSGINSYAFRSAATTGTRSVVNNIFFNKRTNATIGSKHYAVSVGSTTGLTIDYNDYFVNGTGGTLGFLTTDKADLSAWRTASGQDVHSISSLPAFISNSNLHLQQGLNAALDGTGIQIGSISTDFDGDSRNNPPDMGADEFSNVICNPPTTLNQVVANVSCNGFINGSIITNPSGGSNPYTFLWSNGASAQNITGLSPGTYSVVVTAIGNCTASFGPFTVTQPATLSASSNGTNILCTGNNNGSASVTVSGGTSPYTYLWSPSSQTTPTATGLSANSYAVTVTDHNGCSITSNSTVVGEPQALVVIATTSANVFCNGYASGSVNVNATGGTGAYTYLWSPSGQTTASATGLVANTYTVTVTDANGCSVFSNSATIAQPSVLGAVASTSVNVTCNGYTNGSVTVNATGGTGAYTYLWSPSSQTTATATGLTAGTYSVTVTDANGCSVVSNSTVVTQPVVLNAVASTVANAGLCYGNTNGSVTVSPSGGTSPYTYLWSPSSQTTGTVTGLGADTYTVVLTDQNGCSTTSSTIVTQPAQLTVTAGYTSPVCDGSPLVLSANSTGGSGGNTYSWTGPGFNVSTTGDPTTVSPTPSPGTYTYTVTSVDQNGCVAGPSSVNVTIHTLPIGILLSGGNNIICSGQSITLGNYVSGEDSIAGSLDDGTSFSGFIGPSDGGSVLINIPVSPTTNTTYRIASLHDGYCPADPNNLQDLSNFLDVIVNPSPVITITPSGSTILNCINTSVDLLTTVNYPNAATFTYSWTPGGETTDQITVTAPNTYVVTVTESNNSCTGSDQIVITHTLPVSVTGCSHTDVTCNAGNDGAATAGTISNAVGIVHYTWSPSGGNNATATGLTAGSYTVTISDDCGSTSCTEVVGEPAALSMGSCSHSNVTCFGGNNGTATAGAISNAVGIVHYAWSNGATTQTASSLNAGTYTVTVNDNCFTRTCTEVVTQPDAIVVTATPGTILCNGGTTSVNISAVGGSNNYSSGTGIFNNVPAGGHTYAVADNNGCTGSTTITITEPAALSMGSCSHTNVTCNGGNNGTATAGAVSNSVGTVQYAWSPSGGTDAVATGLSAGTYTVSVSDNCFTRSCTEVISQPDAIVVTATPGTITCNGGMTSVNVSATGGSNNYASGTGLFNNVAAGSHTYTVTDNNGCSGSATLNITQPDPITVTANFPNLDVCSTGTVTLQVQVGGNVTAVSFTGGLGTHGNYDDSNFPIITEEYSPEFSESGSHVFVTVTTNDPDSCGAASAQIDLDVKAAPSLAISASPETICMNGSSVLSFTFTGVPPFTFEYTTFDGISTFTPSGPITVGTYTPNFTGSGPYVYTLPVGPFTANPTFFLSSLSDSNVPSCDGYLVPGSDQVSLTIETPVAGIINDDNTTVLTCIQTSVSVTATGGASYSWNGGSSPATADNSFTTAGTYTVTATTVNGCTATADIIITSLDPIAVTATPGTILCNGGTTSVVVTATGGNGNYTSGIGTFNNLTAGSYSYTVTDGNGCTGSTTITITQPDVIVVTATPGTIACNGGTTSVNVSATGGSNNYTSGTGTFNNVAAGSHTYTVTDNNGCTGSATITITEPAAVPSPDVTVSNICGSSTLTASNYTGSLHWSTNETTASITVTVAGTYSVYQTTSPNGCVSAPAVATAAPGNCSALTTKLFIQGYYRNIGSSTPMDNFGAGGCLKVTGGSANASDVDYVTVHVMNSSSPYAEVTSATGVLQTNGTLNVTFSPALSGNYYLKVTHRNSVETWSKNPVTLSSINTYDFSTANSQAYGNNQVEVESGIWAIYSGDISDRILPGSQDGIVESSDFSDEENAYNLGLTGYVVSDITGDGVVNMADYSLMQSNVYYTIIGLHP